MGEVAEFDTQVPHWFGSTGDGPAEVLSIFGRPGERMHVRASRDRSRTTTSRDLVHQTASLVCWS